MLTAQQVPFENKVFMGDSPKNTHGEYEDEQLEKFSKIEVHEIFEILIIVYRGQEPLRPRFILLFLKKHSL